MVEYLVFSNINFYAILVLFVLVSPDLPVTCSRFSGSYLPAYSRCGRLEMQSKIFQMFCRTLEDMIEEKKVGGGTQEMRA